MHFSLAGERNDARLLLTRLVVLVEDETVSCKAKGCALEFTSAEFLAAHVRRKHDPEGDDTSSRSP